MVYVESLVFDRSHDRSHGRHDSDFSDLAVIVALLSLSWSDRSRRLYSDCSKQRTTTWKIGWKSRWWGAFQFLHGNFWVMSARPQTFHILHTLMAADWLEKICLWASPLKLDLVHVQIRAAALWTSIFAKSEQLGTALHFHAAGAPIKMNILQRLTWSKVLGCWCQAFMIHLSWNCLLALSRQPDSLGHEFFKTVTCLLISAFLAGLEAAHTEYIVSSNTTSLHWSRLSAAGCVIM